MCFIILQFLVNKQIQSFETIALFYFPDTQSKTICSLQHRKKQRKSRTSYLSIIQQINSKEKLKIGQNRKKIAPPLHGEAIIHESKLLSKEEWVITHDHAIPNHWHNRLILFVSIQNDSLANSMYTIRHPVLKFGKHLHNFHSSFLMAE